MKAKSESSLDAGQERLVERLDAVGCEEKDAAIHQQKHISRAIF
jgi:hypothetical protein